MRQVDVQPEDVFIIISNSGRNPLSIEMAEYVKKKGCKVIVVTALEVSKSSTSRHSSGKLLYEFADVVLDNQSSLVMQLLRSTDLTVKYAVLLHSAHVFCFSRRFMKL